MSKERKLELSLPGRYYVHEAEHPAMGGFMRGLVLCVVAGLILCGCSAGRQEQAASACAAAIGEKLAGKSFSLDVADMRARASPEAGDVMHVVSTLSIDTGLSTAYQQTFECRARFDNSAAPSVIFLQFNWNTADLKKVDGSN